MRWIQSPKRFLGAEQQASPSLLSLNSPAPPAKSSECFGDYFQPPARGRVKTMDAERLAIGKALGVGEHSNRDFYRTSCFAFGRNLPTGLVPLSAIGKAIGVPTPAMNAVVELGNILLGRNFRVEVRSLERLGLAGLTPERVRSMAH